MKWFRKIKWGFVVDQAMVAVPCLAILWLLMMATYVQGIGTRESIDVVMSASGLTLLIMFGFFVFLSWILHVIDDHDAKKSQKGAKDDR